MMLAHAEKIDILHDHHLVVLDWKQRAIQERINVPVVSLSHERQRLGHAFRSLQETVPPRLFTQRQQQLCDQGLNDIDVSRASISTHILYWRRMSAPPCYRPITHEHPLRASRADPAYSK